MTHPRAFSLFLFLALGLAAAGCNKPNKNHVDRFRAGAAAPVSASQSAAGITNAPPPPGPVAPPGAGARPRRATANVGSPYWYEQDNFGNPLKTHSASEDSFSRQVLILVNVERVNRGLRALLPDVEAGRAAKAHSEDMEGRGFFDHYTPEGWTPGDRLQMTGASGYSMAGENVAFGQQTADEVMRAWMGSPGHRANILHADFTHIGIGVAAGRPYWTQVFLRR